MRLVLQRVTSAAVHVDGNPIAAIGDGLLILAGVESEDSVQTAQRAAEKIARFRIFADVTGKMNRDVLTTGGSVLLVSQFTLAATTNKGRRPSFDRAARPEQAVPILDALEEKLRELGVAVRTGEFGAAMQVDLVNDGPVTFVLEL